MLGHDHAMSGGVAFAALVPLFIPLTGAELIAGTVFTAGAALLCDIDEPGSRISRSGGFLTAAFAHVVRRVSGGHRHGTHSLLGAAVFTGSAVAAVACSHLSVHGSGPALALTVLGRTWLGVWLALMISAALKAVPVVRGHFPDVAGVAAAAGMYFWHAGLFLVPLCVALGVLAHIAGDMLTHGGCPLLFPFSEHDFHDSPIQFTTGKFTETYVVSPLLSITLCAVLLWDTGGLGWLAAHTSGHLAR